MTSQVVADNTPLSDMSTSESNYLKKGDFTEQGQNCTILGAKLETVGQGQDAENKYILFFKEHAKGMVLNKTNLNRCIDATGARLMSDLKGAVVNVYNDQYVEYAGKQTGGIRIRKAAGDTIEGGNAPRPAEAPDDDIPF